MPVSSLQPRIPVIDAYDILKISLDANEDEIKKAFKKMSLKLHPDKVQNKTETTTEDFTNLKNAYDTLADPERRKIYDRFGIDLGEEKLEASIWNTCNLLFLGPYFNFLIKLTATSIVAHLFTYSYVFTLLNIGLLSGIAFFAYKIKFTSDSADGGEGATKKQLYQVMCLYLGLAEIYGILTLLSVWLSDTYYVLMLVLECTAPYSLQNLPVLGGISVASIILGWFLTNWWTYIYGFSVLAMVMSLLASLLATIVIHIWMETIESNTKGQVRKHRERMREMKALTTPKSGS